MEDRIAIVSDVHGNWNALQAVFADIDERGITEVVHLGDTVGYGVDGQRCLQLLRERAAVHVQGNHDGNIRAPRDPRMRGEALTVLEREVEILTEEEIEFLLSRNTCELVGDLVVLVHGALTDRDDYILDTVALARNREIMRSEHADCRFLFFGHTHLPMVICGNTADMKFQETRSIELDDHALYLINPGSVGQPRDKCPLASYGILDLAEKTMTIARIEYDINDEQWRMREASLDEKLIKRIGIGC